MTPLSNLSRARLQSVEVQSVEVRPGTRSAYRIRGAHTLMSAAAWTHSGRQQLPIPPQRSGRGQAKLSNLSRRLSRPPAANPSPPADPGYGWCDPWPQNGSQRPTRAVLSPWADRPGPDARPASAHPPGRQVFRPTQHSKSRRTGHAASASRSPGGGYPAPLAASDRRCIVGISPRLKKRAGGRADKMLCRPFG